ncbi:MAG: N-acetyltransferase family protein [Parvularculaceae bacterium]
MDIREAAAGDWPEIWRIVEAHIRSGEVLALPRDMREDAARAYWLSPQNSAFVATIGGEIAGASYIRANQQGGGAHVANAAYATADRYAGRGVARALCLQSLDYASAQGYKAMQFNFVVESNARAVRLWRELGFEVVGRLPGAFEHPRLGRVDALVMFRELDASSVCDQER